MAGWLPGLVTGSKGAGFLGTLLQVVGQNSIFIYGLAMPICIFGFEK